LKAAKQTHSMFAFPLGGSLMYMCLEETSFLQAKKRLTN